jgi:hypothetical protein
MVVLGQFTCFVLVARRSLGHRHRHEEAALGTCNSLVDARPGRVWIKLPGNGLSGDVRANAIAADHYGFGVKS